MAVNIAVVICVAVSLAGVICACNSCEQYRIIKFDTLGGSEVRDLVINIADLSDINTQIPKKDGYVFSGWFFDSDDYLEPLEKSGIAANSKDGKCIVYAKWIKAQSID